MWQQLNNTMSKTTQRIYEIIKLFGIGEYNERLLELHLESLVLQAKVEQCELQLEQLKNNMNNKNIKKDCMFQYATQHKILVDTNLITREEADKLMADNIEDLKSKWDELDSPQMAIWINCESNTSYNEIAVNIDFRDCILKSGHFYRVEKKLLF